jgi:hypothetical protein
MSQLEWVPRTEGGQVGGELEKGGHSLHSLVKAGSFSVNRLMELTLLSLVNGNQEPTCNPGKHRPGKSRGNWEGGTEIDLIRGRVMRI